MTVSGEQSTMANDAQKEVLRLRFRIIECVNYYKSKREALEDFERVKSKYGDQMLEIQSCRNDIDRLVDTSCQQCGKQIVMSSSFEAKYHADCPQCEDKEEQQKSQERQNKKLKEAEVNPLIKYCYEINRRVPLYEKGPERTGNQELKEEEERYVEEIMERDKFYKEHDFVREYNPSYGISKSEWERQRKKKKALMKQERKEYDLDIKLKTNSPTYQIFDKLDVTRLYGCTCEAEYLRRGMFCPVCRLMVKVHEYALGLFKDAAQGRSYD